MPIMKMVNSKSKVNEELVEQITDLLEQAKSGNIESIAMVIVHNNGDVSDCWTSTNMPFIMVGALESIKVDFMNMCIEKRDG